MWFVALIPLLTADSRFACSGWLRVPFGIAAFSALLGFLTPMLVDRFSQGDPNRAGLGYAVNVAGCILGPLLAGFILLPHLDERYALIVLALPWLLVGVVFAFARKPGVSTPAYRTTLCATRHIRERNFIGVICIGLHDAQLRATVSGRTSPPRQHSHCHRHGPGKDEATGRKRHQHDHPHPAHEVDVRPTADISRSSSTESSGHLFWHGTTHRSMLSWGIDSTAVDLVPSVPALFGYYHSDGPELLKLPRSHVVFDDGRRFLERTTEQYDVIVIDPPPPIGAAGSSLLYSREFYVAAKKRLRPDGILQQWFPGGDIRTTVAVARALKESFPYVRAFVGINGWGIHYLASRQPIPNRTGAELAARMPASAAADLVEWGPYPTAEQQLTGALKNEISIDRLIAADPGAPVMQDDRPVNEYSLLRDIGVWLRH